MRFMTPGRFAISLSLVAASLFAHSAAADFTVDEAGRLTLYGDARFRVESDFDSQRADGIERADRDRLRVRFRLGAEFAPQSWLRFGVRARTGSHASQTSPHLTIHDFDDNPTGDHQAMLDKYYLRATSDRTTVWFGRASAPFWKQNEMFLDDDVIPAGVALRTQLDQRGRLTFNAAYASLPDGGIDFNGDLAAGQLVYAAEHDDVHLTLAGGGYFFRGRDGAHNLRNGNGARDYQIFAGSAQTRIDVHARPLTLGLDVMYNAKDYSDHDDDPFTVANHDQTDGVVLSLNYGKLKQRNDWLFGYYFARIEAFALNASYAQDDWVRWGSATQTDSSDLEGHELRFAYVPAAGLNVVARFYLVDAITSQQDGKRFRLDVNYKF